MTLSRIQCDTKTFSVTQPNGRPDKIDIETERGTERVEGFAIQLLADGSFYIQASADVSIDLQHSDAFSFKLRN